jgi:hypothetical protein
MIAFLKSIPGKVVVGVIVALIVGGILTVVKSTKTYKISGVWKIKMDYEIFFSDHISKYKQCKVLADGDFYLVQESDNFKGLSLLEISLSPENLSDNKKFITLVLDFHNFDTIKQNNYKGEVAVRFRQVDSSIIKQFILPFLSDPTSLNVPSNYSFTLEMKSQNYGIGLFEGKLTDGTITTKGSLEIYK